MESKHVQSQSPEPQLKGSSRASTSENSIDEEMQHYTRLHILNQAIVTAVGSVHAIEGEALDAFQILKKSFDDVQAFEQSFDPLRTFEWYEKNLLADDRRKRCEMAGTKYRGGVLERSKRYLNDLCWVYITVWTR